jgi:hypothetical protein
VKRLALLLLIAACVQPNAVTLRELEDRSRTTPRPDLDEVVDRAGPVPLVGRGYTATLPMVECRVPAVNGRVNDVEMPCVLDTGASHVALTGPAARAAALYVPEREPVQMVSPGYATSHRLCVFESLKLGPTVLAPGAATVSLGESAGRTWIGLNTPTYAIVGGSVLSHFRITFDFARREVRLAPHGRSASPLALWVPVEIHGRRYHLLVDSGATRPILEPWVAVELGLLSEEQARRHEVKAAAESKTRYSRLTLESLTVADRTFRNVRAASVRTFGDHRPSRLDDRLRYEGARDRGRPVKTIPCALGLLVTTACTTLTVRDVERQFADDLEATWLRVPDPQNLDPAVAANAPNVMRETEKIAVEQVARQGGKHSRTADYSRALLACCYLAQGDTAGARTAMADIHIQTPRQDELTRENAVIYATSHAVDVCHGVKARAELDRMFAGKLSIEEFVPRWGYYVGINLPPPTNPNREKLIKLAVSRIRSSCFETPEAEKGRTELRRLVAEYIYNEAASLLVMLPPPNPAPGGEIERWLAGVAVGSFVTYSYLMPDILAYPLTAEQKQWQREQIVPVYKRAKEAAGHFLSAADRRNIEKGGLRVKDIRNNDDAHRALYAALLRAETDVIGWISTR